MSSLRVLLDLSLLARSDTPRGVARYAHDLALGLHAEAKAREGLTVLAVTRPSLLGSLRHTADVPAALEAFEAERRRPARPAPQRPLFELLGRTRHALTRVAEEAGAHVMHSLDPTSSPRASLGVPRVVTCHHLDSSAESQDWHGTEGKVGLDARRFLRADRVIATSRATAQDLIATLDVPRAKIQVVYNGIDERLWREEPAIDDAVRLAALGLRGQPYLVCVGAVDRRKNVDGVLAGLRRALDLRVRMDLVVAWIGRLSKGEQQHLEERARYHDVEGRVRQLGYVSDHDLAALYRSATALVFASHREGFGYPVVEAMSCGCPVITSNCSSLVEIADQTAVTVDPKDTAAIADAIAVVADDNAERRRLGERGVGRARHFTLASMLEGTLDAYRHVVARETGDPLDSSGWLERDQGRST